MDEPTHFDVWPENELPICVYRRLSSQWMTDAMGRPLGIRMEAMSFALELEGVPRDEWREVVNSVQVMEGAALEICRAAK